MTVFLRSCKETLSHHLPRYYYPAYRGGEGFWEKRTLASNTPTLEFNTDLPRVGRERHFSNPMHAFSDLVFLGLEAFEA